MTAISYRGVAFAYPDASRRALDGVDLDVEPGEILLVVGPSASGKSTLLRCANGLVPHASGGRMGGSVVAFGRSTRSHRPRELADVVGFVAQDPESQFVVDHVERDLAFVLENLGFSQDAMRRRVEETLALSYSADSPDQVAALDLFQYVAGRPGHDRGEERFIVGERRQHQNLRFRQLGADLAGGFDAAAIG